MFGVVLGNKLLVPFTLTFAFLVNKKQKDASQADFGFYEVSEGLNALTNFNLTDNFRK